MDQDTANKAAQALLYSYEEAVFSDITRRPAMSSHHRSLVRMIQGIPTPTAVFSPYRVDDELPDPNKAQALFVTPGMLFELSVDLEDVDNPPASPPVTLVGTRLTEHDRCICREEFAKTAGSLILTTWTFTVDGSEIIVRSHYGDGEEIVFARALAGELGWDTTPPTV